MPAKTGEIKLVTYNVAGLPEGISASHPSVNMPRIGELLNFYDIALVQEDFAYPIELRSKVRHPYASAPFVRGSSFDFGDGLSQFTRLRFADFRRRVWQRCSGYFSDGCDCLTPKGFTFARYDVAAGVTLDVYNLHMDSGGSPEDKIARAEQIEQLITSIAELSSERAVVVAGDTNIGRSERALLRHFMTSAGLHDACAELRCAEPRRIDRVFYRSSPSLLLRPRSWRTDARFVDASKRPLSDHLPVAVTLEWQVPAADQPPLVEPEPRAIARAEKRRSRSRADR